MERAVESLTLEQLRDEVTYWRQDAAARLLMALALAKAAEIKGEEDRCAQITVSTIFPTRAALSNALNGEVYWPVCEGCSSPVHPGDAVYAYEDGGEGHCDCDQPQMADPLPENAYRHQLDEEFTPEGIQRALAAAEAWLGGEAA